MSFLEKILRAAINILNGASTWLIMSFILAGLLHNVLSPDKFQKMLGNKKISSLFKSTISGVLLPICSCGVIPLGLSMYYSGAYLGPTLAFMIATPIINPVAVILSFGLLGKQIGTIYLITGFIVPIIIGLVGNMFGGKELKAPGADEHIQARILEEDEKITLKDKLILGFNWSFNELALVVSKYVILGMLLAGVLLTIVPQDFIQKYLGNPSIMSLGSVTVLAAIMYVCAVGHIPFIAALVASGAAPGVAITFLMAGCATNLPEIISMFKIMGKRSAIIYSSGVLISSLIVGYATNLVLLPKFKPVLNFDRVQGSISAANKLIFVAPLWMKYFCSLLIFIFCIRAILPSIKKYLRIKGAVEN